MNIWNIYSLKNVSLLEILCNSFNIHPIDECKKVNSSSLNKTSLYYISSILHKRTWSSARWVPSNSKLSSCTDFREIVTNYFSSQGIWNIISTEDLRVCGLNSNGVWRHIIKQSFIEMVGKMSNNVSTSQLSQSLTANTGS